MSDTLKVAFMCLIWALVLKLQIDYEIDQTATRNLKDGLEIAVHDASLMLDADELQDGNTVFNQELAQLVFAQSMKKNMAMQQSSPAVIGGQFSPEEHAFFNEDIKIVHMEFIDDATSPSTLYPCVYGVSCGIGTYQIPATISGPAIVVVGETISPKHFSEKEKVIRQAIVYELKRN